MTEREIDAIPRKTASQILNGIAGGRGYEHRVEIAMEVAMNVEWWRGFYAAKANGEVTGKSDK